MNTPLKMSNEAGAKLPPIAVGLDLANGAISGINVILSELDNRLAPTYSEEHNVKETNAQFPEPLNYGSSQISRALSELVYRLADVQKQLDAMLRRTEV